MRSFVIVGLEDEVATIKISDFEISFEISEIFFTISLNFPAILLALSSVLLIKVICLFEVCLTKFSQVFRPIFLLQKEVFFYFSD